MNVLISSIEYTELSTYSITRACGLRCVLWASHSPRFTFISEKWKDVHSLTKMYPIMATSYKKFLISADRRLDPLYCSFNNRTCTFSNICFIELETESSKFNILKLLSPCSVGGTIKCEITLKNLTPTYPSIQPVLLHKPVIIFRI